ncbi:Gfo/Idh/MocA family protein [Rubellimicrobium rubrum]|nr:Gfo/Idh/MocA family oxidoreductase [Rubellimicrobium rubrum]
MLRIGLMGAANIAARAIVQPARRSGDAVLAAVAARRPGAAAAYAAQHDVPVSHESYEALIADPGIDAVYIALPPSDHAEWGIRALEAGKHVLCEKPLAMNAEEARGMVAVADRCGLMLMEAFHDSYHPVQRHVAQRIEDGALGRITGAEAVFCVSVAWDPANIRFDPARGGGAMMDLGCYPLHWLRSVFGSEPEIVEAKAELTELGLDRRVEAVLDFGGVRARMLTDLMDPPYRGLLRIEGTEGWIEVDNPCLPHKGHSIRESLAGQPDAEFTLAGGTTYDFQLDAFVAAVRTGVPPLTGGRDAVGNMAALDAIYRHLGIGRSG